MSERLTRYFQAEAAELCDKIVGLLGNEPLPSRDAIAGMLSAARGLRGGATMARLTPFAVLAGQLERVLKSVVAGRLAWTPLLAESLRGTVEDVAALVPRLAEWGPDEDERAHARSVELSRYAAPPRSPEGERIVPIGSLFEAGPGPHILYVAVTPQTQFESQLRDLGRRSAAPPPPASHLTPVAPRDAYRTPMPTPAVHREAYRTPVRTPAVPPAVRRATPPAPRPATPPRKLEQRRARTATSPRGHELRELLQASVSRLSGGFAYGDSGADLIPIEALVYDSRGALARARELANAVRGKGPDLHPETLGELIDLIELAARG